jgi:hypothetical protein
MTERIPLSWDELKILLDATKAIYQISLSPLFSLCFFIDLHIDPIDDDKGVIVKIRENLMRSLPYNTISHYQVGVNLHKILTTYKGTDDYPTVLKFLEKVGSLA